MSDRVVVAMSGGVDSSVAAGLLVREGYDVVGVTLQLWPDLPGPERESGCCSLSAVEDARRVASHLGIPHYVLNFRESFAGSVIRNFKQEYLAGRTPNPCVRCNQWVKFDLLLEKAASLGARFLATGHYARTEYSEERRRWLLLRAEDAAKDQTYALHTLTQRQLSRALFPLGCFSKGETRALARELAPLVAAKPDSQEICFVPGNDYGAFLAEQAPESVQPGDIVDRQGRKLGEHRGVAFYTLGQRKGLRLSAPSPLYVTALRPSSRQVVVGPAEDLLEQSLVSTDYNLIATDRLEEPLRVQAKIRYNMQAAPATLYPLLDGSETPGEGSRVRVTFDEPQRAITPGQAVVCYQGEVVVGGGTIQSVG